MIGNDCNQSSLMRIVQRQKDQQQNNVDLPKIQVTPQGSHLYKLRNNFESTEIEERHSNAADLKDLCPTGNVANLKEKLAPVLFRTPSNMSDKSYISINSIISKSSSYRNKSKRRAKFYTYDNEYVRPEGQSFYEDDSKRLSASMNDLNLNEYENYVKLPFVLPVGETSDNVYEDVNFFESNKGQSTEVLTPDGEEDDFGFEMCQMPNVEKVEVFNREIPNVQEPKWSMYKR